MMYFKYYYLLSVRLELPFVLRGTGTYSKLFFKNVSICTFPGNNQFLLLVTILLAIEKARSDEVLDAGIHKYCLESVYKFGKLSL